MSFHYAKCYYAECHYAECHGAKKSVYLLNTAAAAATEKGHGQAGQPGYKKCGGTSGAGQQSLQHFPESGSCQGKKSVFKCCQESLKIYASMRTGN